MRLERPRDDVTDGQLSVLLVISKHGSQTLGALSDHERVSPPSMNRTVNSLEASGLVTREASPDDGRKVLVALTDAAKTLVTETRRRREVWFSRQLSRLSPDKRAVLEAAAPILSELADS